MAFFSNALSAVEGAISPKNYSKYFKEGVNEIVSPFTDLLSGKSFKSFSNFSDSLLRIPLQGAMGLSYLAPSLMSRPDLDASGPIEDIGTRLSDIYSGLLSFSPSYFKRYGMVPSMIGLMGGNYILSSAAKTLGKGMDWLIGERPTPMALQERFMERISPRASDLMVEYPQLDENSALSVAAQELFQQVPQYRNWLQGKL